MSMRILFLLLFISFIPVLIEVGITAYGHLVRFYICVLLVVNIVAYLVSYYQFIVALRFVKKIFQCEEAE
jgi:hypothetical protein